MWRPGTPRYARVVLVTVRWWFVRSRANAAVCLEAAILGSLQELGNLIYRGPQAYGALPQSTKTTLRVWAAARTRFTCPNRWSPFTPLWGNPNLPHLRTIQASVGTGWSKPNSCTEFILHPRDYIAYTQKDLLTALDVLERRVHILICSGAVLEWPGSGCRWLNL